LPTAATYHSLACLPCPELRGAVRTRLVAPAHIGGLDFKGAHQDAGRRVHGRAPWPRWPRSVEVCDRMYVCFRLGVSSRYRSSPPEARRGGHIGTGIGHCGRGRPTTTPPTTRPRPRFRPAPRPAAGPQRSSATTSSTTTTSPSLSLSSATMPSNPRSPLPRPRPRPAPGPRPRPRPSLAPRRGHPHVTRRLHTRLHLRRRGAFRARRPTHNELSVAHRFALVARRSVLRNSEVRSERVAQLSQ